MWQYSAMTVIRSTKNGIQVKIFIEEKGMEDARMHCRDEFIEYSAHTTKISQYQKAL